jgi:hypothetical protein
MIREDLVRIVLVGLMVGSVAQFPAFARTLLPRQHSPLYPAGKAPATG